MTSTPPPPQTLIITGANSGIGLATVISLLSQYNEKIGTIIMACRSEEKCQKAISEVLNALRGKGLITSEQDSEAYAAKLKFLALDLNDLQSVEKFSEAFPGLGLPLDCLILNAGVVAPGNKVLMFETNVLGHFYLAYLLEPALRETHGKMIWVASEAHNKIGHHLKQGERIRDYVYDGKSGLVTMMGEYGFSKLCNIWLAKEFHKRYHDKDGIRVNSLHPGAIATNIGTSNSPWYLRPFAWATNLFLQAPEVGARTSVHVAMAPEAENVSGEYFSSSRLAIQKEVHADVNDEARWKELWELCEDLCNEKLGKTVFSREQ